MLVAIPALVLDRVARPDEAVGGAVDDLPLDVLVDVGLLGLSTSPGRLVVRDSRRRRCRRCRLASAALDVRVGRGDAVDYRGFVAVTRLACLLLLLLVGDVVGRPVP